MTHIFVVDDDPHIRELVTVFLRAEGYTVTAAMDGVDALITVYLPTQAAQS